MKRILAVLVLMLGTSIFGVAATTVPAQAGALCTGSFGTICGDLHHSSPDHGYDAPITVTCNLGNPWSDVRYVAEGQDANCHDTDGIWVNYGTTITCTWHGDGYGSATFRYSGTWIKIYDNMNWRCVVGVA